MKPKYVVFKGGGVCIAAHIGVISVLDLSEVIGFGGTSAGAIMACLCAVGYTATEIKTMMDATDFSTFEDGNWIQDLEGISKFGIHPGDVFQKWIEAKIKDKIGKDFATFKDLKSDLRVFATDLWTQSSQMFSPITTPDIIASEAVRASMSIPGLFRAFTFSNGAMGGHIFVDGGVVDNYPIDCFDESCECPNPDVIGSFLHSKGGVSPVNYGEYGKWAKNTFESLMNAQDVLTLNDPSAMKRSIVVDTLGISTTDFGITSAQKQALDQSGIKAAQDFGG